MKKIYLLVRNDAAKETLQLPDVMDVEQFAVQHQMKIYESYEMETIAGLEKIIADKRRCIGNCNYEDAVVFRDREWDTVLSLFGIKAHYNNKASSYMDETYIYAVYNAV
ncbi:MAG TPA: hypothetical protein PKW80_12005 [Bacteroidales bacterium]|nr:hypothetical protein [Bacteroidales bacterium]